MPKHAKTKTPPVRQRIAKGELTKRVDLWLTAPAASALAYLIEDLEAHPREGYPANKTGAGNLALEEAAATRGWTPPKEDDE